jgi:flotillin
MFLYKVAEPNEALIISGMNAHRGAEGDAAGLGFKIIVGKGAFYLPFFQKVRHLSLDIHEAELDLDCVTTQGIQVGVKAVVIYKIADDFQSIANAARRFLEQEEQMDVKVHNVFAGHLRSIIGTMTIEDMIRNRDALTKATRESSAIEMQRLGLTIDSLQIQEIEDNSGYIGNLAAPEAARVAKEARIAQAAADREATEREQEAEALKVAARSQSQIKQAQATAEAQRAQNEAEQAGPLAAATAKQQVVVQETKVAQLEAERTEQQLQTQVRKPADAEAYKTRTIAEADRDARISQAEAKAREVELEAGADAKRTKLEAEANSERTRRVGEAEGDATRARGLAEGDAIKAKGLAEAEAIKARADALASNQEAVIGQQIAEQLPQIVGEAAKAFGNIGQLTVLNGAEGVGQLFSQVLGMGAAAIPMLRGMLDGNAGNGHHETAATAKKPAARAGGEKQES